MIHIVFNEADIDVLQKAIELDETLQGEVLQVEDDYAVGPLKDIYTEEGIAARRAWWKEVLTGTELEKKIDEGDVDDNKLVAFIIERLQINEDEKVWIWAAQNKHDVSGYYWLISQLKDFQGRIYILYLNNLPFINEKGQLFYPEWISTIQPKEMTKAKKLARLVTASEFEVDPDEWTKLCNEEKGVRLLEGGKKLGQKDYDFYDADLKNFISGDWQKASKIIHQFLSKNKQTTGDMYLLWRLKQLVATDMYDVQGELKNMKDFELKKKSGQLFEATQPSEQ
ncbi:DUF1835 domain-containing protein [Lacibacter sediminis]|uniref:DUF1835 domain-containing protein n=1 Tax=Lacibacter sediminis TaxID=2760713 RepID=A0A7G5XBD2_9BACT|nr:DUF1835 domain-containing protein [Lacibacter sediminis]QNA42785.1 DUF1835 domain-containing protein [Lacibacter sediminis]